MGKYSNVILANAKKTRSSTAAHQGQRISSRGCDPSKRGIPNELPPAMMNTLPSLQESQASWQERVAW